MRRALALSLILAHGAARAASVKPVFDMQFMGGQHFFEGTASSLGGNVDAIFTPVVTINPRWSIFPTYMGTYRGTRDVQELAGGGTLFQDSTSHSLLLKSVHKMGNWKLKPSVGARADFLRETKDEDWGDGLFDYRKLSGGLESEWSPNRALGGRLAYDYYKLMFPNYRSLESATDPTLSRELAGEKVLDSGNHMVTLSAWLPLPAEGRMEGSIIANRRGFDDQPLVQADGSLSSAERKDASYAFTTNFTYPMGFGAGIRSAGELGFAYGWQDSNQNHYDVRKTVFVADYYDFSQWSVAPRFTAALGQAPWVVALGAGYESRNYGKRPVQNAGGDYLSEALYTHTITTLFSVGYPVTKNMSFKFQTSLAWADSNMQYEKVFQYNYKIANYLFGFAYEY